MFHANSVQLRTGRTMPLLGFGTYQVPDSDAGVAAIAFALDNGYKLLDCASFYMNERAVGRALKGRDRRDFFIVSKVWNDAVYKGKTSVRDACIKSIEDLYVLWFICQL